MSNGFVPDHIAQRIDRVAHAHLCRLAGINPDQNRRMSMKVAKVTGSPSALLVSSYDLYADSGKWRLQWYEKKWVLIALQPATRTMPRMKIFSDTGIRFPQMINPKSPMQKRLFALAEEAIGRISAEYDYDSDPHIKRASAVIVGDIFYSTWGYDQTNVDFYQVVGTTPKMVKMREIDKKMVSGRGQPTEYYTPQANKFVGSVFRKKLGEYQGEPWVNLTSYSSARKWGGKPVGQTGGAYGH